MSRSRIRNGSEIGAKLAVSAHEGLGLAPGDAWDAAVADYRAFRERLAPGLA